MTTSLDPSLYPASYRTSAWRGGLKILGFMTFALVGILARTQIIERGVAPGMFVFIVLLLLFLLLTLLNVTFAKVTLYPDRIERVTWFGTKSMLRADVAGLELRRRLFGSPMLVSKRGRFEGIQLSNGIEADAAWEAWMAVAEDGDATPTRSAMIRGGRITLAVLTMLLSLGCLLATIAMHVEVNRLATQTLATATAVQVRSKMYKGNLIYSARLIFDRKQRDGNVVHCDVPDVQMGMRPIALGEAIKISPRNTSCLEPDVVCETCTAPSDTLALALLIVGAVSGLICFLLFWITWREKSKPA